MQKYLIFSILFIVVSNGIDAKTITVRSPLNNEFSGITKALRDLEDGDTLHLEPGAYIWETPSPDFDYDETPVQIHNKKHVTLSGNGNAFILTTNSYATLMKIRESEHVTIDGVHFGHVVKRGHCTGGVVEVEDSTHVTFRNCVLHGSGIFGITTGKSQHVLLEQCAVVQTSEQAIVLAGSSDITLKNCLFANNAGASLIAVSKASENVMIEHSLIMSNRGSRLCWRHYLEDCHSFVTYKNNIFAQNQYNYAIRQEGVEQENEIDIANVDMETYRLKSDSKSGYGPETNIAADLYMRYLEVVAPYDRWPKPENDTSSQHAPPQKENSTEDVGEEHGVTIDADNPWLHEPLYGSLHRKDGYVPATIEDVGGRYYFTLQKQIRCRIFFDQQGDPTYLSDCKALPCFKLRDFSLVVLGNTGRISDEILRALNPVTEQECVEQERDFLNIVENAIGKELTEHYQELLLNYAQSTYQDFSPNLLGRFATARFHCGYDYAEDWTLYLCRSDQYGPAWSDQMSIFQLLNGTPPEMPLVEFFVD